ncbi:MAG TPA: peptidoglycan bridge formation glycyltransferase FemA/FemB family protein [Verrucomicrobiae bacterium]|nr:peptidoglycan bridge formation glycyltransferase FemA/FemB family protein [Verrucomicrobiae bacterium]
MADPVYQVEVDATPEQEWSERLEDFLDGNLFQTWSYARTQWGEKNVSRLVLRRNGDIVSMAQVCIAHFGFLTNGIGQLRWGPIFRKRGVNPEPEILRRMALALRKEYVEKRRLFLRVLPNVFVGSPRADIFQDAFSQFHSGPTNADADRTSLLDLTPSLEQLRRNLDQKWRNQLNRAEKNEMTIIEGDSATEFQIFLNLYEQMRERKKFETRVNADEFAGVQEHLPKNQKLKILICVQNGIPAAGIVCSAMGESAIYLFGATNHNGLKSKAAYLLQWTIIRRLKDLGFRYYDLGGINPKTNPGVYHFKRGLGGKEVSRIAPFESCNSIFSSLCMKTANAFQPHFPGVHKWLRTFRRQELQPPRQNKSL